MLQFNENKNCIFRKRIFNSRSNHIKQLKFLPREIFEINLINLYYY